jgi:hypothetical protein
MRDAAIVRPARVRSRGEVLRAVAVRTGRALLVVAMAAVALLALQNVALNLLLPRLLNGQPERMRIDFAGAWMVIPGRVHVRGIRVRDQGPGDQWLITADTATGTIHLPELGHREFHADHLRLDGVSFRYRRRLDAVDPDAPPPKPLVPGSHVEERHEPPIFGLDNPPSVDPAVVYPKPGVRWLVALDDVEADHVRELWIGDYRLTGDASAAGSVWLAGPYVDVDGTVSIASMRADIGDTPIAQDIHGDVAVRIDGMDRTNVGPDKLRAISARAKLAADVQDLRFVDFYLAAVPWLSLDGAGHGVLDLALDDGEFRDGSAFEAYFPDLLVRFVGVDVSGAGSVRAEVGTDAEGQPQSRVGVAFDDFAIVPDGSTAALVEGLGFRIDASSPDVTLDRPFTSVDVVVDLPESRIPDAGVYDAYFPKGIGLSLQSGTATMRGHLVATSVDSRASGDVYVRGDEVVLRLDDIAITGDVALHANLYDAHLDTGVYDLSGTTLD